MSCGSGSGVERRLPEEEPPPPVSNQFSVQRVSIDSKKGSVTVSARLPGAGEFEVDAVSKDGKVDVGSTSVDVGEAGTYEATVKPSSKAKRVLKKKGKLKTKLTLTYSPDGGEAATKTDSVTLKMKKKGK